MQQQLHQPCSTLDCRPRKHSSVMAMLLLPTCLIRPGHQRGGRAYSALPSALTLMFTALPLGFAWVPAFRAALRSFVCLGLSKHL